MYASLTNSDIIAAASLLVALFAFFLTAWQARLMHQHSRLSVKPILAWGTEKKLSTTFLEMVSTLTNKGLGPAIVVERYFTLNGLHFQSASEDTTPLEALVKELLPEDLNAVIARQALPGIGSPLLPGDAMAISHLVFPSLRDDRWKEIESRMGKVQFVVVYEDIYGQRRVFKT
jgi:hypothetical protein